MLQAKKAVGMALLAILAMGAFSLSTMPQAFAKQEGRKHGKTFFNGELKMVLSPPDGSKSEATGSAKLKLRKVMDDGLSIAIKIEAKSLPMPPNGRSIVAYLGTKGGTVNLGEMKLHGDREDNVVEEARLRATVKRFTDPANTDITITIPGVTISLVETAKPDSPKPAEDAKILLQGKV